MQNWIWVFPFHFNAKVFPVSINGHKYVICFLIISFLENLPERSLLLPLLLTPSILVSQMIAWWEFVNVLFKDS